MPTTTKIIAIGNSAGIILPKEILARLKVEKGDAKKMVKTLNQKAEEARIIVRSAREEAWKEIQEAERKGEMSEDDKFAGKNKLQEIVDEYNKKIEEIRTKKEAEVMTV